MRQPAQYPLLIMVAALSCCLPDGHDAPIASGASSGGEVARGVQPTPNTSATAQAPRPAGPSAQDLVAASLQQAEAEYEELVSAGRLTKLQKAQVDDILRRQCATLRKEIRSTAFSELPPEEEAVASWRIGHKARELLEEAVKEMTEVLPGRASLLESFNPKLEVLCATAAFGGPVGAQ